MELGMMTKRGASYFALALLFLLALFIVIVDAVVVSEFAYNTPRPPVNFSGTRTITVNLTHPGTYNNASSFNITNVSFYAMVPGGSLVLIGHNTTANLTQYTFGWNTNSGSFPDNLTYEIRVNASATNMSRDATVAFASVVLNSNSGFNISVDNTPPAFSFFGSSSTANPDASNYINSTPQLVSFNFTVTDTLFTAMEGMCQVVVDFSNSTGGGNLTSTAGTYRNNTFFNLSATVGTGLEGRHDYRVQCRQDPGTNLTGNSTARTLVIDTTKPVAQIDFQDIAGVSKTSFGLGSEVKVQCKRSDATSGFNRTEILVRNPVEATSVSKKIDNSEASYGTSLFTTEHIIPSAEVQRLGDYFIECRVDDRAGNRFITNKTFKIDIQAPRSTSAFKVPGFEAPVGKLKINSGVTSDGGRLTIEGISRLMQMGGALKVDVKGQDHVITVTALTDESVTLNIASEPLTVTINKGETVDVDTDKDGTNDLAITFHKRFPPGGKHADLTFKLTDTPAVTTRPEGETGRQLPATPSETVKAGKAGLVVTLIVIVVIIILGYFMLSKRKK